MPVVFLWIGKSPLAGEISAVGGVPSPRTIARQDDCSPAHNKQIGRRRPNAGQPTCGRSGARASALAHENKFLGHASAVRVGEGSLS